MSLLRAASSNGNATNWNLVAITPLSQPFDQGHRNIMKRFTFSPFLAATAVVLAVSGCCAHSTAPSDTADSGKRGMLNSSKDSDGVSSAREHMTRTHGKAELK